MEPYALRDAHHLSTGLKRLTYSSSPVSAKLAVKEQG